MSAVTEFPLHGRATAITGDHPALARPCRWPWPEAGARVAILGRWDAGRAAERVAAIEAVGGEAMAVLADVLERTRWQAACDEIMQAWGSIDGLVNAAGRPSLRHHRPRPGRVRPQH